jgi:tetratricopeptide (TPR) repeat protein
MAATVLVPASFVGVSGQSGGEQVLDLSTTSDAAATHFWAGVEDSQNVFASRAVLHLTQAMEADPGFGLARVLYAFAAPMPNDERQVQMARGLALMDEATTDELLLATAMRAWRSGGQAEASRILALLSRMNPDDPHLLVWANQIANARGDRTDPAERQRRAIERFPDYAPPHNLLAYALWAQGDKSGALDAVRDYAELAPDHPNAHDSYAEMLQFDGRYQEALKHYARAVELDASYEAGYTGAAETYVLMGEYDQAAEQMSLVAEHAATPAGRVNHMRGVAAAHMLAGDRTEAMQALASAAEFAEAEDLSGAAVFAHLQMAVTAALMGRERDIESHLARAEELGDRNPTFYGMEAVAYAAAGQGEAAREAASQIPAGNAFWSSIGRAAKAMALVEEGDLDGAMNELAMANAVNPMTQAVMGICLDEMGREAEAAAKKADVLYLRQFGLANPFAVFAKSIAGQR